MKLAGLYCGNQLFQNSQLRRQAAIVLENWSLLRLITILPCQN